MTVEFLLLLIFAVHIPEIIFKILFVIFPHMQYQLMHLNSVREALTFNGQHCDIKKHEKTPVSQEFWGSKLCLLAKQVCFKKFL